MSFNSLLQNGVLSSSPSLNGATSAALVAGTAVPMIDVTRHTLSATVTLLAETNTITLSAVWEVSDDGTTWKRAPGLTNATPTVFGTGTAGADTAVTRVVDPPSSVYGWRNARCSVAIGVTTGAAGDTATIAYNYMKNQLQG